jgi:hypothetical protein
MQSGSYAGANRGGLMFQCLVIRISLATIYYVHARARYIFLATILRPGHVHGVHT